MNKKRVIGVIIVCAALCAGFYWTAVRPYFDRKYCNKYAAGQVEAFGGPSSDRVYSEYLKHYSLCLASHGIGE